MAKTYYLQFGTGDPRTFTGLAATFLLFKLQDGTNVTAPGITEVPTSTGIYYFTWGTTTSISFLADAATTSPGSAGRYIVGSLDPADRIDEVGTTLVAIGTSNIALGTTNVAIGTTNVALGTSNIALGSTSVALCITNVAIGTTLTAIATSLAFSVSFSLSGIGTTASSFGNQTIAPGDLFGYMKRVLENLEGDQAFYKASGVLDIYARGTSTLLREKTIANSISTVIKSGS